MELPPPYRIIFIRTHMSSLCTGNEIRIVISNWFTTRYRQPAKQPSTFGFGIVVNTKGLGPEWCLLGRITEDLKQICHCAGLEGDIVKFVTLLAPFGCSGLMEKWKYCVLVVFGWCWVLNIFGYVWLFCSESLDWFLIRATTKHVSNLSFITDTTSLSTFCNK